MSVEVLSYVCNNLTSKIKKLSLSRISAVDSKDYILEDEHVIAITNCCPKLEELDLGGRKSVISEVALSAIIDKLQNLVKLKLPDTDKIVLGNLLKLRSMPNLKYLHVDVDLDLNLFDYFPLDHFLVTKRQTLDEKIDELKRETPFMKALVKNLPNLKINKGRFEIAAHDPLCDPRYISYENSVWLWEKQFKPTDDFVGPL